MYYKCVKFHKHPISGLGGVALTRYMDGRTDGRMDGRTGRFLYSPPKKKTLFAGGLQKKRQNKKRKKKERK